MRSILPLIFALSILAGCNTIGVGIGGSSGGVYVGSDRVGGGVAVGSGMAVAVNSYGDFLYSGNGEAYANNKVGLKALLDGNYVEARNVFEATLNKYPSNPDAVYYLGLTLIYLNERDAGYALLLQYSDPSKNRIAQEVKWWAAYCQKKPELTPKKIHEVMNRARGEGYQRQREEDWEDRRGLLRD